MSTAAFLTKPAVAPGPKAHELRTLAAPAPPRPVTSVGIAFAVVDYVVFYAGAATFVVAPWWPVKAVGVLVSGVAVGVRGPHIG